MNAEARRQHETFKACRTRIAPAPVRPLAFIARPPLVIAPVPTSTQVRFSSVAFFISNADRAAAEDMLVRCGPTVREVVRATASVFDAEPWVIFTRRRIGKVTAIRMIAMAATRMRTSLSLPVIGYRFGGFGHTTVLNAIRKADPVAVAAVCAMVDEGRGS